MNQWTSYLTSSMPRAALEEEGWCTDGVTFKGILRTSLLPISHNEDAQNQPLTAVPPLTRRILHTAH